MPRKKSSTATSWVDPDDAPALTKEWFEGADVYDGGKLVRRGRGRPRLERPKEQITLRLDADVIEAIRGSGPGWTGRINDVLARSVRAGRFTARKKRA